MNHRLVACPTPIFGTLIRRYQRFLADVLLDTNETITAYCPNPGRMLSCSDPGMRVCCSLSKNTRRKRPYTLEMVHNGTHWIGVHPARANAFVKAAIDQGYLFSDRSTDAWESEVPYGDGSRIDWLHRGEQSSLYVEVKSVSYAEDGKGWFPDAVSARATKHMQALQTMVDAGHDAVVLYCIQRGDVDHVSPARHIDPAYADAVAMASGVKTMVWPLTMQPDGVYMRGVFNGGSV